MSKGILFCKKKHKRTQPKTGHFKLEHTDSLDLHYWSQQAWEDMFCVESIFLCQSSSEGLKLVCILYFWNYIPLLAQVRLLWPWNEDTVSEGRERWCDCQVKQKSCLVHSVDESILSVWLAFCSARAQQWEQCKTPLLVSGRVESDAVGDWVAWRCFLCARVSSHSLVVEHYFSSVFKAAWKVAPW